MNAKVPHDMRWFLLDNARREVEISTLLVHLSRHNISAVLIKGWVARNTYPKTHPRNYGDIDIAVARADYQRCSELLRDPSLRNIRVDLHHELRHLDTLDWLTFVARTVCIPINGVNVLVPRHEDHLRILSVHWLNDGGQYRERLWDIYYAVANRPAEFDWKECLEVVSSTRRRWVIVAIGLAHKYLGLDIDDLPFADEARDIPKWITDTVEAEWATEVRLRPMHTIWKQPRILLQQLRKRFPPNPIQATIECEGEFDDRSRVPYQIRSVIKRALPSIKRVTGTLLARRSTTNEH